MKAFGSGERLRTTLLLRGTLAERLRKVVEATGLNKSDVLRTALHEYLSKTEEGFTDAKNN